jgi:hypothetical protein
MLDGNLRLGRSSADAMRRAFKTFIGVDLGGGKGKTTAVCRLRVPERPSADAEIIVEDQGPGANFYDEQLIEYLLRFADNAVLAIDAPLNLPVCVRCTLSQCPGTAACDVPTVSWFRNRDAHKQSSEAALGSVPEGRSRAKPRYTPYTQRATEVLLHEDHGITPRETLGQGMGPLTARMAFLRRALADRYQLHHNLLEVYPKATLTQLFPDAAPPLSLAPLPATPTAGVIGAPTTSPSTAPAIRSGNGSSHGNGQGSLPGRTTVRYRDSNGKEVRLADDPADPPEEDADSELPGRRRSQVARLYKRSGHALPIRTRVLEELPGLRFGPGQWREFTLQNDHQFDALICAYTAYLWARQGWQLPDDPDRVFAEDGWIWFPPARG